MVREKKYLYALFMLILVACVEEPQISNTESKITLKLDAVPQAAITRTSTGIQSTLFDPNEDVNAYFTVTVDGEASALISEKDNTLSTAGNPVILKTAAASNGVNALSPKDGSTLYFPPGDNDKVNVSIYALYPSTVTSSLTSFAVQTPQTTDADYKASDLMYASATSPKTDQAIHLQFNHKMAKLIINASGEEGLTMKKITLKSLYTTIGWNATTGDLGSTSGSTSDIEIASNESFTSPLTGVALFPPQTKSDTYFMEVTCQDPTDNNAEKTAYFKICTKEFEGGKVYTINVKIGPRNLKDDGIVLIEPWPSTVGVVNIEAVGNMGLAITSLTDDTNTMSGSKFSKDKEDGDSDDVLYHFTYNGKSCTPVPTVTDGKDKNPTTLVAGTDYEVKYYNNLNAGTALVVVTGKGDYKGFSTFETFTINRAANTMSYPNNNAAFSTNLSKNAIVQNALVKPSLQTNEVYGQMTYGLYSDAACTNAYTGDIATIDVNGNVYMGKKGTVYVKATMDDTGNFEAKTVSYALTITAGDASSVMTVTLLNPDSEMDNYYYTGAPIHPAVSVMDNGITLDEGIDYTVSWGETIYQTHVSSGTNRATVIITGINEYEGTKTIQFNIIQAANIWTTPPSTPSAPIDCGATKNSPQGGTKSRTIAIAAETFALGGTPKFGSVKYKIATTQSNTSNITDAVSINPSTGIVTGAKKGTTTVTAYVDAETTYNDYAALSTDIDVTVEEMTHIYVYNGTTEHFASGSSPSAVTDTYWCQVRNGTAQPCTLNFSHNATVYALIVGAGGGCDNVGRGGCGGYVYGTKTYDANTSATFYVFCGGGGQSECQGSTSDAIRQYGGWPGGGRSGTTGCSGAGGGVTAIATTSSTDDWTTTNTDTRLLVAGAGGGSSNGNNGGEDGDNSGNKAGTMVNCTSGREKWMGGRANTSGEISGAQISSNDGGGGGAGFYGGFGGNEASGEDASGGHGGSNFIHDDWSTNSASGKSATQIFSELGYTMERNGHPKDGITSSNYAAVDYNYAVYPGYVIIKYKYNR